MTAVREKKGGWSGTMDCGFGSLNIKTIGGRLLPHGRRGICKFLREINGPLNVDAMLLTLRHTLHISVPCTLIGHTLGISYGYPISQNTFAHLLLHFSLSMTYNIPRFSFSSTHPLKATGTQLPCGHGTASLPKPQP